MALLCSFFQENRDLLACQQLVEPHWVAGSYCHTLVISIKHNIFRSGMSPQHHSVRRLTLWEHQSEQQALQADKLASVKDQEVSVLCVVLLSCINIMLNRWFIDFEQHCLPVYVGNCETGIMMFVFSLQQRKTVHQRATIRIVRMGRWQMGTMQRAMKMTRMSTHCSHCKVWLP